MSAPVRRGGRGTLADGTLLTWSVAEGGRGRRCRATLVRNGLLVQAVLLETDGARRPARLEVDMPDGLLTLHPAHDRDELHGNVVTPGGMRHLALAWSDDHELLVAGQPVVATAAVHRLESAVPVGESVERAAVVIGPELGVATLTIRFERAGRGAWHVTGAGVDESVTIDPDGLPAGLADAATWPLEA